MRIRGMLVVGLVVAAVAAVVVTVVAGRAGAADACVRFTAAAEERRAMVTGAGEEILVVGDSYSVGLGVKPAESWPTRLAGRVRVEGFSGSGYSAGASGCPAVDFATRAETAVRPGTGRVVVEGGLNDFDQPAADIEVGFDRLMEVLDDRRVVVVGPPRAPSRAADVVAIDDLLRRLAASHGAAYVPMLALDLPYLADGLHLTPEGHRMFGDAVAAALAAPSATGGGASGR